MLLTLGDLLGFLTVSDRNNPGITGNNGEIRSRNPGKSPMVLDILAKSVKSGRKSSDGPQAPERVSGWMTLLVLSLFCTVSALNVSVLHLSALFTPCSAPSRTPSQGP